MKLGVSNIAWSAAQESEALSILGQSSFSAVEVAPTRIADWHDLTAKKLLDYRNLVETYGLTICSLQAILFGRPEAQLLADEQAFSLMYDHISRVADIAAMLGATVVVFGSPKNRLKSTRSRPEAFELAVSRLQILGNRFAEVDVKLALEPVPAYYGSDFIDSLKEAKAIVRACRHPSIQLHLDTGCLHLGGEDIASAILGSASQAIHFHISEPDLGSFDNSLCDHVGAGRALAQTDYRGWAIIEMRQHPSLRHLQGAVSRVAQWYK